MQHRRFQDSQPTGSGDVDFEDFYHIRIWWPSWLFDLDQFIKDLLTYPLQARHEICLKLA